MSVQPLQLDLDGLQVRGLRCGTSGARKVLALHGWLDNAASFLPLAALLPALDLVLLDLPGHGHSDHLPAGTPYTGANAIVHVLDVADALGWDRFSLLGHSMGAGISSLLAAVAPQRVQALIAIEGLGGLSAPASETVTRLREHVTAVRSLADKRLRVFPDLAAPVRARMRANQLSEASARLLVERGVKAVDGGWSWRSDPRLMLPTAVRMTDPQIRDVLAAIVCPTQVIYATPAQVYLPEPQRSEWTALLPHGQVHTLPGHHHLHMDQPEAVAALITAFVDTLPPSA
ncbi:alpha/beta hydrolase [Stenotrophomonas sp. YIM B06876]|uniref:alpha/beta fold hydrolase n=1 Tax=Stenotrophomonas sp. YIM B06876 TaxID=3060211 RepID=UPI00273A4191|nr:alpha/beta hydrolase [Stenotrophomonas sp. YIM B06876]